MRDGLINGITEIAKVFYSKLGINLLSTRLQS